MDEWECSNRNKEIGGVGWPTCDGNNNEKDKKAKMTPLKSVPRKEGRQD